MSSRNLSNVVLFNLSVRLWTGQKKLDKADINNDLPKDLGSLGHKKTVDPKSLCPLSTVKRSMEVALSNVGIRFMGSFYAIPIHRLDEVRKVMDEKVKTGMDARQKFLDNYLSEVESWISQHPDWESRLRPAVVPKDRVASAIHFGYDVFTINAVPGFSLDDHSSQMGSQLFEEVSDEINEIYDRSVLGRDSVNRRIIKPFERIRAKLYGFSFVDPIVLPLIQLIDKTIKAMPDDGPITGKELAVFSSCMMVLSSEDKMRQYVDRLNSDSVNDDDDSLAPLISLPIQGPHQGSLLDIGIQPQSIVADLPEAESPVHTAIDILAPMISPMSPAPAVTVVQHVVPAVASTPQVAPVRRKMKVAA
jgi:hypothetical protein